MNFISVGIGAGLVSALLIAVIVKATPLAVLLYLLAPLPVLIASLGWNHRAGLVGTIVGSLAMGLATSPVNGLGFALGTALPAWWLAYLSLLGRPDSGGTIEWYPLGQLLTWIAATAALTVLAATLLSTADYAEFRQNARAIAEAFFRIPGAAPGAEADDGVRRQVVELVALLVPSLAAQGLTLVFTLFLWAAARIVSLSGRLPRPWPYLPGTVMPRGALGLLAAGAALAFLGGFPALLGLAVIGALLTAFSLQGLAALHDRTAGRPGRYAMLGGIYVLLMLTQGAALLLLALLGLADTAFGLRKRPRPGAGPSATI